MCYRVYADAQKDESKLSSKKEESLFTPREGIDARNRNSLPLMSASGFAAMFHRLLASSDKDEGGIRTKDAFETKPSAVKSEVEKVD
jgi:hypothetical protein